MLSYEDSPGNLLKCEQPKAFLGYGIDPDDVPPDGLLIEDDEGWAWFVGPDFGCVNFEAM